MNTKQLRQKILDLAIRGKLVPQDPNDEPASVLLERIQAEKERLIKEGKIKRSKKDIAPAGSADKSHYGELPDGWAWATLGELGFYKKGPFGSSITKAMFVPESDTAIKVYEQKNAIHKNDSLGTYYISPEKFQELKGFETFPDDIIVSCAGTIGEAYVMPQTMRRGVINQALMRIMLYDKKIMDFYLLYFDFILKDSAQSESKGTAIKNIPPFDVLKQFAMPIPPLREQMRIVETVASFNAAIDEIENNKTDILATITAAKSKILSLAIRGKLVPQDPSDEPAAVLLERIRAEREQLTKAGKIKRGKNENSTISSCDNSHYEKIPNGWGISSIEDVFIINPRNAVDDDTNASFVPMTLLDEGFVNHFTFQERLWGTIKTGFTHFQNGDVGLAKISPCLENRKSAIFKGLLNGVGAGTTELHIFRSIQSDSILPEYLLWFFKSDQFISYCISAFAGAVGQQRVGKDHVAKALIPIPPVNEQKRIVSAIDAVLNQLERIAENIN